MAGRFTTGYGAFKIKGRQRGAHRVVWELAFGPIPDGLHVCHHCDNPSCCEITHLFLGTNAENTADRDRKGRTARGERSGARLHPDRMPRGERHCRAKISAADACEIRSRYAAGGISLRALGREFGISHHAVWRLIKGYSWTTKP